MKGRQVKPTIVTLVFIGFVGIILVVGCATNHKGFMTSPRKVCIIELKNDAEYQKLLAGKPQTCGMRSGRVYLQPGETCGRHSTEQHEEMLVFLAGWGTALIGEEETAFEVGQGKVSYIPPHTIHNINNTGIEPLVYVYCVAPVQLGSKDSPAHEEHHH
jgi:mannose-6-phosphate isomerase-like protein (cupin superfamily)